MKIYNKTHENIFSTDEPNNKVRLKIEHVSAGGMDLQEYTSLFRGFLNNFYLDLFNNSVKLAWLRRKFEYHGEKMIYPIGFNSININIAFVKFLRRNIGKDIQIITRGRFFSILESYFNDLFPGFDEGNPFENPDYYKFPFKNISIDFFPVVFKLDNRMEFLQEAEDKKMSYAVFVDYVVNYVFSENDFLGREKYQIKYGIGSHFPFYITDVDKNFRINKKQKI